LTDSGTMVVDLTHQNKHDCRERSLERCTAGSCRNDINLQTCAMSNKRG
jgi:hypothetical protein